MMTEAEKTGAKAVAKSMSKKDLEWQIANAKKCGLPADMVKLFKDELAARNKERRMTMVKIPLYRGCIYVSLWRQGILFDVQRKRVGNSFVGHLWIWDWKQPLTFRKAD